MRRRRRTQPSAPRSRRRWLVAACVVTAATSASGSAFAQGNYRLAPVGGRTSLVGGTGLAYGRDSASAFLNPATIVRVDPGRLAFSVSFFTVTVVTADRWYQPGSVDRGRFGDVRSTDASITNSDFDPLPSSLCVFLGIAELPFIGRKGAKELRDRQARLGLCLASVQNSIYSFNGEDYAETGAFGRTRQAGTIRQTFRRLAVGPSYAMYIDDHLALGASVLLSRASFRSAITNSATTVNGDAAPITSGFFATSRGDSYDLHASIGATYRLRNQTFAAVVEAASMHLSGSGALSGYTHYEGTGAGTTTTAASGPFAAATPLRVAIGTGYEASWGSAELNVGLHYPLGPAYQANFQGRSYETAGGAPVDKAVSLDLAARSRGVVNIGIGGEVFLSPRVSLLGGLATDLSSVPGGALGKDPMNYYPANTHRVAASFGYGSHGEGGDLLLGAELSYGWGERLAVNPYQLPARVETTPENTYSVLLVFAGSTSFKNIKRAVEDATTTPGAKKEVEKPRETERMKTDLQADDPTAPKPIEPAAPATPIPSTTPAPPSTPDPPATRERPPPSPPP